MTCQFLISSNIPPKKSNPPGLDLIIDCETFRLFSSLDQLIIVDGFKFLLDGFLLPRREYFEKYNKYSQQELISELYKEYKLDLINYVKGNFNLVVANEQELHVYNDRHSIKTFFIYKNGNSFSISNELALIAQQNALVFNELYPGILALFQHSVSGLTMYKDVTYSRPATRLCLSGGNLATDSYWVPDDLMTYNRNVFSTGNVIDVFSRTIADYVSFFKPKNISLTLTGGRDTRSILAGLLNIGITPSSFTFGFPSGKDVVASKKIAEELGIPFSNHFIEDLNSVSYRNLSKEIIGFGNPFIHIHRAHRLDAIKKEKKLLGNIDMLFVGAMGGDYIKGVSFNDYIVTEFVRRQLFGSIEVKRLVEEILCNQFVKCSEDYLEEIVSVVNKTPFFSTNSFKEAEFLIAFYLIGCTHDIQDINLFCEYSDMVIAPFMDIDFLEVLFQSPFSMFSNDRSSKNPLNKLKGGELQANLISSLYPQLADIPFANLYSPKDLLGNRLKYLIKRMYLHFLKVQNTPTFSYEEWFQEFVDTNIPDTETKLSNSYDFISMKKMLKKLKHSTHEGYWHKYSNPIMLSLYLKHYGKQ